jgi:hypothetical protein
VEHGDRWAAGRWKLAVQNLEFLTQCLGSKTSVFESVALDQKLPFLNQHPGSKTTNIPANALLQYSQWPIRFGKTS